MKLLKEFNEYLNNNFKKWFGNSVVIDKRGNPLVVYHGTPDSRDLKMTGIFKTSNERYIDYLTNDAKKEVKNNRSYFFTDSLSKANSYADAHRAFDYQNAEPKVFSVYLKIENPLIVNAGG